MNRTDILFAMSDEESDTDSLTVGLAILTVEGE